MEPLPGREHVSWSEAFHQHRFTFPHCVEHDWIPLLGGLVLVFDVYFVVVFVWVCVLVLFCRVWLHVSICSFVSIVPPTKVVSQSSAAWGKNKCPKERHQRRNQNLKVQLSRWIVTSGQMASEWQVQQLAMWYRRAYCVASSCNANQYTVIFLALATQKTLGSSKKLFCPVRSWQLFEVSS